MRRRYRTNGLEHQWTKGSSGGGVGEARGTRWRLGIVGRGWHNEGARWRRASGEDDECGGQGRLRGVGSSWGSPELLGAAAAVRVGDEGKVRRGCGGSKRKKGVVGERFIASGGGENSDRASARVVHGCVVYGGAGLALREVRAMVLWHRRSKRTSLAWQCALAQTIETGVTLERLAATTRGVAEAVRHWHGGIKARGKVARH